MVALRKESVDRNFEPGLILTGGHRSLSARRAWIEIYLVEDARYIDDVALRKESVDRNFRALECCLHLGVALRKESVDRNRVKKCLDGFQGVALRKESVDRNPMSPFRQEPATGRSPQGERG